MLNKIQEGWQEPGWINRLVYPVSLLYTAIVQLRLGLYRFGALKSESLPGPVIVVGNMTVGGTGKTPLVVALTEHFKSLGKKPGVLTRGYKGNAAHWPKLVDINSDPVEVGDEAVVISQRCQVPVMVGPNRVESGRLLFENHNCDILISDDGFQHLKLKRDIDIVVIDSQRGFGNGWCLPSGPLREPTDNLNRSDIVMFNGALGEVDHKAIYSMKMEIDCVTQLDGTTTLPVKAFVGKKIHAIAGIGNPGRFFDQLVMLGLDISRHPFDDHHDFSEKDIQFNDDCPVLMTEKDAVKCRSFGNASNCWFVPISANIDTDFFPLLESLIEQRLT